MEPNVEIKLQKGGGIGAQEGVVRSAHDVVLSLPKIKLGCMSAILLNHSILCIE
jgi:hypothetical protein